MEDKKHLMLIILLSVTLVSVSGRSIQSIKELEEDLVISREKEESLEILNQTMQSDLTELSEKITKINDELKTIQAENTMLEETITEKEKTIHKLREDLKKEKNTTSVTKGESLTQPKVTTTTPSGGTKMNIQATAYCPCVKCNGKWAGGPTASGKMPKANHTIAVDPKVIPLGTKVTIEGYGTFTAEDTGGAVKGNIIDIYFNSHAEAMKFGRKNLTATVHY